MAETSKSGKQPVGCKSVSMHCTELQRESWTGMVGSWAIRRCSRNLPSHWSVMNMAAKLLAMQSSHSFKKRFHAKVTGDCHGKKTGRHERQGCVCVRQKHDASFTANAGTQVKFSLGRVRA